MNTGRKIQENPEPTPHITHEIPLQSFSAIYNLKPERDYLIQGLLQPGTCTMIFGASGCTKSLFTNLIMLSISLGTPFLDMPTKKHGVLLVDNEDAPQALRDRFHALLAGMKVKRKPRNFWIASRIGSLDSSMEIIDQLLDFSKKNGVGLVVFDTLRRCTNAEENSSSEINSFFQTAVTPFLKNNISVLFLHHAQKQKNGLYRGSGDIMGFTDSAFLLELNDCRIILRCEKSRTSEPNKIFAEWTFGTEEYSLKRLDNILEHSKDAQVTEKIRAMFDTPGATLPRTQITDEFDDLMEKGTLPKGWITKSVLDKALRKLVRRKQLAIPKKGQYRRIWDDIEALGQGKMDDYARKKAE